MRLRERGREVTLEEVAYREALATGIIGGEHETEKMLLDAALDQERAYGWPADADPIHHELTAEGVAELAAMEAKDAKTTSDPPSSSHKPEGTMSRRDREREKKKAASPPPLPTPKPDEP